MYEANQVFVILDRLTRESAFLHSPTEYNGQNVLKDITVQNVENRFELLREVRQHRRGTERR